MLGWSRGGRVYFLADASWMHLQLACNSLATRFHCASLGFQYVYRSRSPPSFSPAIAMGDPWSAPLRPVYLSRRPSPKLCAACGRYIAVKRMSRIHVRLCRLCLCSFTRVPVGRYARAFMCPCADVCASACPCTRACVRACARALVRPCARAPVRRCARVLLWRCVPSSGVLIQHK